MITVENIIRKNQQGFAQVVTFDPVQQKISAIDLTENNKGLDGTIFKDTDLFSAYLEALRKKQSADYLIGGYNELRGLYGRSELFNTQKTVRSIDGPVPVNDLKVPSTGGDVEGAAEPRRLHIGTDVWGPVGTPVVAFMGGMVHSFAFNDHYGDYGATIVLAHQLDSVPFYTLYGHVSVRDISYINEGDYVVRGQEIAHFGDKHENGHWPPHLHFQIIGDMELYEGDYPGVCRYSERKKYLKNCPDPDLILQLNKYIE
ncbi:MAG: peptidoglycan DD-metalloendopeptidase family protein [Chitinophagaceae bacterium]|nr:peptidoglycan DD-metalloendopeptidase family protein [Chitinophagaceae bacterium]